MGNVDTQNLTFLLIKWLISLLLSTTFGTTSLAPTFVWLTVLFSSSCAWATSLCQVATRRNHSTKYQIRSDAVASHQPLKK
ncbi:hypothetical protein F4678DRAFT_61247 [Xylaria arbuscula]|nr:hypothetical protein F4678DRAFT_61247 [Xylaria arbuscula]